MGPYERTLHRAELTSLRRPCPECGAEMAGTGIMHYQRATDHWFVEYACPRDRELFPIHAPETDAMAKRLAKSPAD